MAKTKELKYSVCLTINLGNYESAKIEVGESIDIEDGDDVKKEMARMIKRVKAVAEAEAEEVKATPNKKK